MFQRGEDVLVELLVLAAGLVFERLALGDGVVLLGVGGRDFLSVDAALEDLDGGRVVGRELGEGDELLGQTAILFKKTFSKDWD